ncbi:right-handed parallel beta-helix repeat-containing protein [Thalassotalea sediminis]|uniref:right-handed parallel beta-helix repeat-containing protein n=1 Tax=Thalassotalea sediminis TaxID=1759089 RepID=UPI0025729DA9|nr:right-handed parallel beta-helix repeat-containing protein [Thalassotalea sediminis]
MRFIWFGLFLLSFNTYSLDFNKYCSYTQGEQDCSLEFIQALNDASENKDSIYFEAGEIFNIRSVDTREMEINNVRLIGITEEGTKPSILTDKFHLFDISNLFITNIEFSGIHNEIGDTEQGTSIIILGTKNKEEKASNITVTNSTFNESAEDLLAIWNSRNVIINNNIFKRSGLALRTQVSENNPSDLRPAGSGLLFFNVDEANISHNQFYEMKKVAMYFHAEEIVNKNVDVIDNYIDMENFEKPTQRYGLLGGAGIYIGNSPNFYNFRVQGNRILNYKGNAVRVNGSKMLVKNNFINFRGQCNDMDSTISDGAGIAIKAHYLKNSVIEGNCFQNTIAGISLESWDVIKEVTLSNNTIHNTENAIFVTYRNTATYSNLLIDRNRLFGTTNYGIAFFSNGLSHSNRVTGNTIATSHQKFGGPLIAIRNQEKFYFNNNYVQGQATSPNWNHLVLTNVSNSTFIRSEFRSPNGEDSHFGGIYIRDSKSANNKFDTITFTKLDPGYTDDGTNNSFTNITYQ